MQDMTWIWLIITIVLILIEIITPASLFSIFFAFGALFAMLTSFFSNDWLLQTIIFLIVSIASLLSMRPFFSEMLRGETVSTNTDRLIGTQFVLEENLDSSTWYQQKVNKDTWSVIGANNQAIAKGSLVEVISIDGVKLVVREIKES